MRQINLRWSDDLIGVVKEYARYQDRSVNSAVRSLLHDALTKAKNVVNDERYTSDDEYQRSYGFRMAFKKYNNGNVNDVSIAGEE